MTNIAFYGSHNASIAIERDGKILEVIELERWVNVKNAGYGQYLTSYAREFILPEILQYIKDKYNIDYFDNCIHMNTECYHNGVQYFFYQNIPAKRYVYGEHHKAHACNSIYQSPHREALIVSFDGGGNDGWFNVYRIEKGGYPELLEKIDKNFGVCYSIFGIVCPQINKEPSYAIQGNLVYAGKLMGLASYGKVRDEWFDEFNKWYDLQAGVPHDTLLIEMLNRLKIPLDDKNQASDHDAKDLAATNQFIFEKRFMDNVQPYLDQYPNLPLHIAGGCALNVLLNTKLSKLRETFVAPNASDCGLAVGMLLMESMPYKPVDITYKGLPVTDKYNLSRILEENTKHEKYSVSKMVKLIKDGKIIGVVRGGSEHGPRALGNRSILCDPTIPDMKDILNAKVKNREYYRPFAPVVRLEDVNKYFEWDKECTYMSYCPKVREEYVDKIPSVVHIDKTARVQTVTKQQNEWLYEILTELDKQTGIGVLINTSFNQAGKPLVNSYMDAIEVLKTTQMDGVILNDMLICK